MSEDRTISAAATAGAEPTPRPRGRRPGGVDTRGVIIEAALNLFSNDGYEKVSLRAIARAAEVDPALIHHYFANKSELFATAVLDQPFDAENLVNQVLTGPTEAVGERLVYHFTSIWHQPAAKQKLTAMLRAALNSESTQRPLTEFLVREVLLKIADHFAHRDARLRAESAVSILLGVALCRDLLQLPALAKTRDKALARHLGPALQAQLVDPW